MSRSFKLLVFDWDGTLMDSEARIIACVKGAAVDLDLGVPNNESIRNIIGLGLTEAVTALFPGADDVLVSRVIDRYRHYFLDVDKTPSALFPGAMEILEQLQKQNYMMAVATGKGRQGLDKVLDETGLGWLFLTTRCADETLSKPDPQMLLQIMDELSVNGNETLMIGDTVYDMQMARNAGAYGLAVSYGVHEADRLMQHTPLGCLDDIWELTGWLASNRL